MLAGVGHLRILGIACSPCQQESRQVDILRGLPLLKNVAKKDAYLDACIKDTRKMLCCSKAFSSTDV